jgi:hypothetical protein
MDTISVIYKNVISKNVDDEIHSEHRSLEGNFELIFSMPQFTNETTEVLT